MDYAGYGVTGLLLGGLGTVLAIKLFPALQLLDFPDRYGLKRDRLPYPGGLVYLLLSLGLYVIDPDFLKIIPAVFFVGFVSFIDDREKVSVWIRVICYLLAAFWVFAFGISIDFVGNPFAETNIELADQMYLSMVLTVLWIFFIQQSMNWFDGLKGLCPGVAGIGFLTLGILGLVRPELFFDPEHTTLTLANLYLSGMVLGGFLWYHRGKIILGDTGSQVLGFLLAVMAIWSGAKIMTTLLVLSLPLIDLGLVILRRIFVDHKAPWKGDLRHMPHHLAKRYGERQASLIMILLSGLFGALGIFLFGMTKLVVLAVVFVLVFLFGFRLSKG